MMMSDLFAVNSNGLWNAPGFNFAAFAPVFKFAAGDWLVEQGIPNHHLRAVRTHIEESGKRWYFVFETTLRDGFSGYRYWDAEQLEKSATVHMSAGNQLDAILQRTQFVSGVPYSILARTDCESLQRWIQTGKEEDRWSPQLLLALGLSGLGLWFFGGGEWPK